MRKLIAVLCVVAMMLIMAVPAFANPSVAVAVIPTTEGVVVSSLDDDDPAEDIADAAAKSVVEAVNGEGVMTPAEAVEAVLGKNADELKEVEGYSFSSQFNKITAPEFPVDVEFEGTDENTKIMLINPETGEMVIILPNEDGTFTIPFEGVFALMDPTPEV